MEEPKFWMVVRHDGGNGGRGPTKRHETREAAEAEAKRLVEKERSVFFVLEAVSKHYGEFSHAHTELAA